MIIAKMINIGPDNRSIPTINRGVGLIENESENISGSHVLGKGAQNKFTGSTIANVSMCCCFFSYSLTFHIQLINN